MKRMLATLNLEERIFHAGALLATVGVFLPWISGEWLGGERTSYSGLSFFTGTLGWMVLLLHLCVLLLTLIPLLGGPVLVRRRQLGIVRLLCSAQAAIITLIALSILTSVTFEFSRMEVRFGLYLSLIGSIVATLYAFLEWQQLRKRDGAELFHHPEQSSPLERSEGHLPPPPPPPPPPPLKPEDHHLRS